MPRPSRAPITSNDPAAPRFQLTFRSHPESTRTIPKPMKTESKSLIRPWCPARFQRELFMAGILAVAALRGQNALAQNISWSGGNGAGTAWTASSNWIGGIIPTNVNNAVFNVTMTGSPLTINPNPGTNMQVGSVTVGSSVSETVNIRNLSSATNATLQLYGVGGILLSNISTSHQLIIQNTTANATNFLNLGLVNGGIMYAANGTGTTPPTDGEGGEIVIDSIITGPGGITNAGPGILDIAGVNTYTGNTVLAAGSLELGAAGTLGTGTLFFSGGNLESGGSRAGVPLTNNIVVTSTGYIFSEVASANSTRVFPLSGSLGGTSGSLILGNPNTAANETFLVQLLGSFTFNLPLVVGDNLNDAYNDDTI